MSNQASLQKSKRGEIKEFLDEKAKRTNLGSISRKIKFIQDITKDSKLKFDIPEILFSGEKYEEKRQVTNTKFQFRPAAILLCKDNQHVQFGILLAEVLNLELRVRSGGHDHEGECSGTDALVIDFSELNHVKYKEAEGVVHIGPGAIFEKIVEEMNDMGIGIPHGTCSSVGIAGYTFGGGWGPWTRQKGMGCESLVGATIVLGDASVLQLGVDGTEEERELLWALRGGGGMSYGIVTELVLKAFELPPDTWKITVKWDVTPALHVLELWEGLIAADQNPKLLGTNLKIVAKPADDKPIETSAHHCEFYGFYAGTKDELKADMRAWLAAEAELKEDLDDWLADKPKPPKISRVIVDDGKGPAASFSGWDGAPDNPEIEELYKTSVDQENLPFLLHPDHEEPAPHKITSRLVKPEGLGVEGRESLIRSLESKLLHLEGKEAELHCYVTLGAISGPYYKDYDPSAPSDKLGSAFPYKNRPYTIQYQVWWNVGKKGIWAGKEYHVDRYVNEAEDWIEECRERPFPQTQGSFISFKDSAVPTEQYFLESFDRLKDIKQKYSRDPKNKFSTRKTII